MRAAWWYGVALSTAVWVVGSLFLGVVPDSSPLDQQLGAPIALTLVVSWLAMPLSIALDQRAAGSDFAWDPTTALWVLGSLVWFLNVVVGTAYCLRRHAAATRTPPSRHWETIIAASVGFWLAMFLVDVVVPDGRIPTPVVDALALVVLLTWALLPLGLLLDAVRVRGYTDWNPRSRAYAIAGAVPIVGAVVGGVYLYKRRQAFRTVDATAGYTVPRTDDGGDEPSVPGSPWFRRAGYLFGGYFALVVLLAVTVPSLSESGVEILGLMLWLPFGPFFAACVYKDAAWRRARDWAVGDNWWLYLLSALVQGAAFWYVVRRASKSSRYRRRASEERGSATE